MDQQELSDRLDAMTPAILELDDWSGLVPRVTAMADGVVWILTDPETRPRTLRYTDVKASGKGLSFTSPDWLQVAIHPPHGAVNPELIQVMAKLAQDWTPEDLRAMYDGQQPVAA